ncbi:nucleotidyltransferase domain-containing protein [Actinosynnema pretiosum]|uniref:nucleotidyltransferase domain-containing protein n=1 Tax=Actinosynnema pretiosum TaxID=42197 RepID=UPI001E569D5B|nr:hypothetical protein [Actinosynnema pretiosum]
MTSTPEGAVTWVADVLAVLDLAEAAGARLWIDGGWGVDALLGERTRRHGDLDVVVEGRGVLGPAERGVAYPAESLLGRGVIGGREVECVSAEWAVRFHDEYTGDADDRADVRALCARFGPDGEGCEPRAKSEPGESQCGAAVRHFVVSHCCAAREQYR